MPIAAAALLADGRLHRRAATARRMLARCVLCPRRCGVNRLAGENGRCATGALARIASYGPHFGEEACLVGNHGSGTIFLAGCGLGCCFCQNFDLSRGEEPGQEVDAQGFAAIMLELQARGCHNINLVTPSHVVPQLLAALIPALEGGLRVPIVYNCSGYESDAALVLLDGIIDLYLPDYKFSRVETAERYAQAPDYPERVRRALRRMHRQVGDLVVGADGLARSGLLIRHLLMPGLIEETREILHFIATSIAPRTAVNLMDQYHPCGQADAFAELRRGIRSEEYRAVMETARALGLDRLEGPDLGRLLARLGG